MRYGKSRWKIVTFWLISSNVPPVHRPLSSSLSLLYMTCSCDHHPAISPSSRASSLSFTAREFSVYPCYCSYSFALCVTAFIFISLIFPSSRDSMTRNVITYVIDACVHCGILITPVYILSFCVYRHAFCFVDKLYFSENNGPILIRLTELC